MKRAIYHFLPGALLCVACGGTTAVTGGGQAVPGESDGISEPVLRPNEGFPHANPDEASEVAPAAPPTEVSNPRCAEENPVEDDLGYNADLGCDTDRLLLQEENEQCEIEVIDNPCFLELSGGCALYDRVTTGMIADEDRVETERDAETLLCGGPCKKETSYRFPADEDPSGEYTDQIMASVFISQGNHAFRVYPNLTGAMRVWRCAPDFSAGTKRSERFTRHQFYVASSDLFTEDEEGRVTRCDMPELECGCFTEKAQTAELLHIPGRPPLLVRTTYLHPDPISGVPPAARLQTAVENDTLTLVGCGLRESVSLP